MRTQQKYRVEQKYNENRVSQKVHKKVSIATGEKRKKNISRRTRAMVIYVSRSALLISQLFELAAKKIVCEHLATVADSFLRSLDTSSLGNPNF